ncbi:tropomodulin-2-like [Sycon ciliatum]|uniref:tropomodulin-2-like n=1 Tax=Sycon ciliatum TaxID=27933 RepID=UPI0031F68925
MSLDEEVDAALDNLTEKELAELNELVDPENETLPASDRQRSTTTKAPTGAYDRSKLLEHMKSSAETSTVGKDWVGYDGKKKGKVFKTADQSSPVGSKNLVAATKSTGDAELDALLSQVNGQEMDELAETLGLHGLTSQSSAQSRLSNGGGGGDTAQLGVRPVKAATYPGSETDGKVSSPPPQDTNLEESLQLLSANDPSLTKLCLNNHELVKSNHLMDIGRAVLTNNHLTILQLANTGFGDSHAKAIAEALDYNRTLRVLNLESNKITAHGVTKIIAALKENTSLEELRLNNQVATSGINAETELAEMLVHNRTLRKVGFSFKNAGPRAKIDRLLLRNNDIARQKRLSNDQVSYS